MSQEVWYTTDFHLVIDDFKFSKEEVAVEETSIDEFPHIQPITVTAEYRKPFEMSDEAFGKYQKTSAWEKHLESARVSNLMVALDEGRNEVEPYAD